MSGILTHTVDQIVRQLLIDLGHGSDGGASWPVYAVQMPDTPDECIGVLDQVGVGRGRFQIGGEQQKMHGIQILMRAADMQTANVKANAIEIALSEDVHLASVTVTDPQGYGTATQQYIIYNISWRSGPFPLHEPTSDRKLRSLNVLVNVREN